MWHQNKFRNEMKFVFVTEITVNRQEGKHSLDFKTIFKEFMRKSFLKSYIYI